jgi:hypothetical protein
VRLAGVPRIAGTALASAALAVGSIPAVPLGALVAQTVRPAVVEFHERARGKFELVNEGLFPLTVVLEPRGFRVEESGDLIEEPLDTTRVRVELSAMSFRIPPRQTYTVFYEATTTRAPAWFLISSTLSGARTQSGLNVRIELPHIVYILQKQPLRRSDVVVRAFDYDSSARRARILIENTGDALGRVLSTEVSADGKPGAPVAAFPLFPRSRRWTEVPWESDERPDRLVVKTAHFTLEERRKEPAR